ncbi:hypothetical protein BJ878DRAFT_64311 [Calycina marina]|uniref:NmrA-like domain-containing protein n=1 Tax=Calycina marina TaxID=1763456 RepID=A0A9P7Z3D4_9HELO|nr:hypothetical protein BJ878DRAFT_64311 [Calycina marina]
MAPNILIIGATGAIGKHITQQIVSAKSSFGRLAILTSEKTANTKTSELEKLKGEGIQVFVGDLTVEEDMKKAYQGIDVVVSAVGRGVIETQIPLIKWASEASVSRFFPSEYGTDIEHDSKSPNEKPHQLKLKVRAFAKTINNVKLTYLVTGPYSDMFIAPGKVGSWDVKVREATLLGDGNNRIAFTAMADVGKLVVGCLQHPAESEGVLIVNSFTATPNEILAEIESQTASKWKTTYISLDELKKLEKEMWETGNPTATTATLRRIWTEGGTLYDRPRDNGLIGEPNMKTLAEQIKQVIQKQMKA